MKAIKLSLIISVCFLVSGIVKSQDCKMFALVKEGSESEMTSYDAKNKVTGKTHSKVLGKEDIPGGMKINIESEQFDKKGKSINKGQYSVKCENGVFSLDMSNMIPPESMKSYKEQKVEIKSDNLTFPSDIKVGQTLKDGTVTVDMGKDNPAASMMNMTITIKDRKVEAVENITTPAGTFECYKISSTIVTNMMFNVETKAVDWIAKEVGTVKNETYDKRGNLSGSVVLTMIKR